jgi:hypothetical protein
VEVAAVRLPQRADEGVDRQGGQVPDGAHGEAVESPPGGRPHAPEGAHGVAVEEDQLVLGADDDHARPGHGAGAAGAGLGRLGGELRRQLAGGHPDRAAEAELVGDEPPQAPGDAGGLAEQAAGAGHVEEGLVERQPLDERGHGAEQVEDLLADLGVAPVAAPQEDGRGAEALGPGRRHGRVDAVAAGLVGRRRHHPPGAVAAHHDRLPDELGAVEQLDGDEEGVHVHVQDRGRLRGHSRVNFSGAVRPAPETR